MKVSLRGHCSRLSQITCSAVGLIVCSYWLISTINYSFSTEITNKLSIDKLNIIILYKAQRFLNIQKSRGGRAKSSILTYTTVHQNQMLLGVLCRPIAWIPKLCEILRQTSNWLLRKSENGKNIFGSYFFAAHGRRIYVSVDRVVFC